MVSTIVLTITFIRKPNEIKIATSDQIASIESMEGYVVVDLTEYNGEIGTIITSSECYELKLVSDEAKIFDNAYIQTLASSVELENVKLNNSHISYVGGEAELVFDKEGDFFGEITAGMAIDYLCLKDSYHESNAIREGIQLNLGAASENLTLALKDIAINFKSPLTRSRLNIESSGKDNLLSSMEGDSVINIDNLSIEVDGKLTIKKQAQSELQVAGIKASSCVFNGNGKLIVSGADGTDGLSDGQDGIAGGTGIIADTVTTKGGLRAIFVGGNGGNGANGARGSDGSAGSNGANADRWDGGNGGWGGDGRNGQVGGRSGDGGYAIIATTLIADSHSVTLQSGNSGNSGNG